jgi:hypothetical protein
MLTVLASGLPDSVSDLFQVADIKLQITNKPIDILSLGDYFGKLHFLSSLSLLSFYNNKERGWEICR